MISKEIRSCTIALSTLLHHVNDEQAELIRIIKRNLDSAAEQAQEMENCFAFAASMAEEVMLAVNKKEAESGTTKTKESLSGKRP